MKVIQLNLDCFECEGPLNESKGMIHAIREAAAEVGARIIDDAAVLYPGQGLTAVVFLAESHIMVTTFPEDSYAIVEVFLCNDGMDPYESWYSLKQYIKPRRVVANLLEHSLGDNFSDR